MECIFIYLIFTYFLLELELAEFALKILEKNTSRRANKQKNII